MNSKERVQAAIARQPVDQVPLGFYAVDHDTVEKVIGRPTFVRNKIDVPVELLIGGTADEVRQAVRTAMERGAPGGGFILGPSHSVAMNTKYENFMAMLDEFVKLRDRF